MPLLGQQEGIARHIKQVAATVQQPKAVLIVSGHWEVGSSRPLLFYASGARSAPTMM